VVVAIPEPIRESLDILALSRWIRGEPMNADAMQERIATVVRVFGEVGAKWAVVGAQAINVYVEPRATKDVDFVVESRKLDQVVERLREVFGDLGEDDIDAAVRLLAIDVDLIRSKQHPLMEEALERSTDRAGWTVPPPEVLIVLKFMSAVSPWRRRDRRVQDAADLIRLVDGLGTDALDTGLMIDLSRSVYPGAEKEFEALLGKIERGEPIAV
jgi:hypothetical protein